MDDKGNRVTLGPGERFNTETLGLSEEEVRKLDASGIIRSPRDDTGRAPAVAGPGEEAVTENRTPTRAPADHADDRRTGRRRPAEIDL
jgi:hypothetical protein